MTCSRFGARFKLFIDDDDDDDDDDCVIDMDDKILTIRNTRVSSEDGVYEESISLEVDEKNYYRVFLRHGSRARDCRGV